MDGAPARYVTSAIEQFGAHGDRLAVVHGTRTLTFAETLAGVFRTARALREQGLRRGDGLVLLAANPPEVVLVGLAAQVLGLRFTSLHLGPATQGVEHVVGDAAPAAVVFDPARPAGAAGPVLPILRRAGVRLPLSLGPVPGEPGVVDLRAAAAAQPGDPLEVEARDGDVARVLYTSGTTGRPKGVAYTFGALGAAAQARRGAGGPPPGTRFLAVTPFAHAAGAIALGMMRGGVAVELYDDFSVPTLLAAVTAAAGSYAVGTYLYPHYLYQLLDHPDTAAADLSPLRFVIYGSSPTAPARLREAVERLGPVLTQSYAQTEAIAIASLDPADHAQAAAGRPELLATVGRPLPGVSLRLVDPDGAPVPDGGVGEVCVSGPTVMGGYWNLPELTEATLRDGWLRTGDLGTLDGEGYLRIVGRLKDMVIVNGQNCYATPIEDALAEHPAVSYAAVVGVPDAATGEAVVAYVVTTAPVDADELRELVRARLGDAHVPAVVEFADALPLTPLAKPDKAALRERAMAAAG